MYRSASLSLRLVDGDPRWPAGVLGHPLPPGLARGEDVEVELPAPGRYVLCASISHDLGDGLNMAGLAEPLGEEFAVQVRESDAGTLLPLPIPASVFD